MKTNHTDITIVLDRSGSMKSVAHDTIGGFNHFLSDQKKAEGTATLTLNQFDNVYERVLGPCDIQGVPELSSNTFVPRGSTALLDAIGRSINDTGKRIDDMPESERPGKVVMVIITDGYENASREFDKHKINDMITRQRDKYSWEFVFLGANQDAIATAASVGIAGGNSMSYASNTAGVKAAFHSTSSNLRSFRGGQTSSMAYSDEDRKKQEDAGV